jgi:hypothetical protein
MRFFPHPWLPGHPPKFDRGETAWISHIFEILGSRRKDDGRSYGHGKSVRNFRTSGFFPRELTSPTLLMFFPNVHPDRQRIPVQPRSSRLGYPGEEFTLLASLIRMDI